MRKSLLIAAAMVALLALQFADCMSAPTQDQQSMQCCGSMPCDPSNQSHDCCKSMASPQTPSLLPASHVALHPPVAFMVDFLPSLQVREFSGVTRNDFDAAEHSPPELYTLHSSFLI
jgi:hypothetical protein